MSGPRHERSIFRGRGPVQSRGSSSSDGLPPIQDDRTHLSEGLPVAATAATTPSTPATARVPRTRAGAAWVGICAATLAAVVLIIFMLQNTRTVRISFLWMDGSLPLALALLIAGVGVGILTMLIGTARLAQLRRLVHDRSRQPRQHPLDASDPPPPAE